MTQTSLSFRIFSLLIKLIWNKLNFDEKSFKFETLSKNFCDIVSYIEPNYLLDFIIIAQKSIRNFKIKLSFKASNSCVENLFFFFFQKICIFRTSSLVCNGFNVIWGNPNSIMFVFLSNDCLNYLLRQYLAKLSQCFNIYSVDSIPKLQICKDFDFYKELNQKFSKFIINWFVSIN